MALTAIKNTTVAERRKLVVEHRLCFNCLGPHRLAECRTNQGCRHCSQSHHTSCHLDNDALSASTSVQQRAVPTQDCSLPAKVLLATAIVKVTSLQNKIFTDRVLIYQGSELSFMTYSLHKRLGLPLNPSQLRLKGIGNVAAGSPLGECRVELHSLHQNAKINVQVHVLTSLTVDLPTFTITDPQWPHITGLPLADPQFLTPRAVDIILGAAPAAEIINHQVRREKESSPIAQSTTLGWIVYRSVKTSPSLQTAHALHVCNDISLQDAIAKFWEQEKPYAERTQLKASDDDECEIHFRKTHYRNLDGRYVVRLPLKEPESQLGDSLAAAQGSLRRLLPRLNADKEYGRLYRDFMKEYEQLGHMCQISLQDLPKNAYFLPHHGVLKNDSATTKLRVVFNGSSPTSTGISVNNILHAGPKTQIDMFDVLLRIRNHKILFATDITKMFRQIDVDPLDWPLQCILWVDNDDLFQAFCLKTVTHDTASAPYDAVRALIQLVKDEGSRYPLAKMPMLSTRYVDDIYGGADTEEEAIQVATQTKDMYNAGCFPLAKWASNNAKVLAAVAPGENPTSTPRIIGDSTVKVLGMHWNSSQDLLQFKYSLPEDSPTTKRSILSEIARLFDPLGFLAPVVIKTKVFMQELWLDQLTWDDKLFPSLSAKCKLFREDLCNIDAIRILRWNHFQNGTSLQLDGFSDASQVTMAAVVYLRVTTAEGLTRISLLCSKTQVAPLKPMTIPRMELTAAWLLTHLVLRVKEVLNMENVETWLWTDSAVTLAWISSSASHWKTFVRNRVSKIQETLREVNWRFIPGKSNPADYASRGLSVQKLRDHSLWWTGPQWLAEDSSAWPVTKLPADHESHREERSGLVLHTWKADHDLLDQLLSHFKNLPSLLRKLAIWLRVIARVKNTPQSSLATPLTPLDLEAAKIILIKFTQSQYFATELHIIADGDALPKNNCLTKLTPYIDHQGVLRVGGRLKYSLLDEEEKHPAIMPKSSPLTTILIDYSHRKTLHGGTQLTLADLRRSVWIVGGRVPVRSFILRCAICTRHRGVRA